MASTVIPRTLAGGELLWTNDSPTDDFSATQVTLPLDRYKFVLLVFKMKASASYRSSFINDVDGGTYVACCPNWDTNANVPRGRGYIIRTTGIEFQRGYRYETYGVATQDDSSMVPISIYGLN